MFKLEEVQSQLWQGEYTKMVFSKSYNYQVFVIHIPNNPTFKLRKNNLQLNNSHANTVFTRRRSSRLQQSEFKPQQCDPCESQMKYQQG